MCGATIDLRTSDHGTSTKNSTPMYANNDSVRYFSMRVYAWNESAISNINATIAITIIHMNDLPPTRSVIASPIAPMSAPRLIVLATNNKSTMQYKTAAG